MNTIGTLQSYSMFVFPSMKKLLILAYDFPPYVSVGGLRPYNWFEYLHEFNVYPVVITRQWANKHGNYIDYIEKSQTDQTIIEESEKGIIYRTPYKPNLANRLLLKHGENKYKFIRKLVSAYYEVAQWIFPIGPKSGIFKEAKLFLKYQRCDLIIASGDPFILFRYASRLSKRHKIPWIADYRDPWTNGATNEKNKLFAFFLSFYEKKIIKTAIAVTTVSDFFSRKISSVVNDQNFQVIPNGYNPDNIEKCRNIRQENEVLNIGFAGTILEMDSFISFIDVLNTLKSMNPDFHFLLNVYGTNRNEEILALINTKYKLIAPFCHISPKIPNEELLPLLSRCNALILFNYNYCVGTKIYDYIALKRKILLCFMDNNAQENKTGLKKNSNIKSPQTALIEKTNSGIIVKDKEHLLTVLIDLYREFSETGQILCHSKDINEYSRKEQTKNLAEIIIKHIDPNH